MTGTLIDALIALVLVVSGVFGLVGSYGLIRLPDPMTRLHAPTKAATVGVGGVLIASMLWFAFRGDAPSWHELLIALFLFITAPVTGLMMAKANLHLAVDPASLPDPGEGRRWAGGRDPGSPTGAPTAHQVSTMSSTPGTARSR